MIATPIVIPKTLEHFAVAMGAYLDWPLDQYESGIEARINHNAPRVTLQIDEITAYQCQCGSIVFIAKPDCFRCVECWRGHQGSRNPQTREVGGVD